MKGFFSGHKKAMTTVILLITAIVLVFGSVFVQGLMIRHKAYDIDTLTQEDLAYTDFDKVTKLMVVAHPDDETIWGGGHLMEGGYLVVCITDGYNTQRKKEFTDAVELSGNVPLILNYPDKVLNERDDWSKVMDKITQDVDILINEKDWDLIVTHNKDGEYGHIHHKMTHDVVTDVFNKESPNSKLYFFGTYHSNKKIGKYIDDMTPISDDQLEFKTKLCDVYKSQKKVVEGLWHMVPYEEWDEYTGGNG